MRTGDTFDIKPAVATVFSEFALVTGLQYKQFAGDCFIFQLISFLFCSENLMLSF